MYTQWCVLIEISMEIGMLNFLIGIIGHCTDERNLLCQTAQIVLSKHSPLDHQTK